jgi:hypothetical protein
MRLSQRRLVTRAFVSTGLALLALAGTALAETITFKPEVLLLRRSNEGKEASYKYAALTPKTLAGKEPTVTFGYSADGRNVRVTITAVGPPEKDGSVKAIVTVLRKKPLPDGTGEDIIRRTVQKVFEPGKPLVADRDMRISEDDTIPDGTVELLQLTLEKP